MRHGPGLSIIVGTATGGVPGNERRSSAGDHRSRGSSPPVPLSRGSSPPVPLSRWERGNAGRVRRPGRLLEPAGRHYAVPPGGRGAARQLGRSVGAGSSERRAFDTERAQAQLSSTLASIPTREAQVAAAQYRIGTLVGRSPTQVARELEQTAALPQLPEVTSIGTPDVVVRYRPDVAAAERFAAAQGALVGAAKASYLPRISIGGTAGYAAPEFRSVGNQGTLRYAVGPVITWPGLNLGRVKAEVDAAAAREEAARAQYSRVVLSAMEDMETSLARYRAARLQVERLQDASAASERAAELARLRFREGRTDFLQVLDAERTQLEAQDRLAQGRIDAATAYAALYKAAGGR